MVKVQGLWKPPMQSGPISPGGPGTKGSVVPRSPLSAMTIRSGWRRALPLRTKNRDRNTFSFAYVMLRALISLVFVLSSTELPLGSVEDASAGCRLDAKEREEAAVVITSLRV